VSAWKYGWPRELQLGISVGDSKTDLPKLRALSMDPIAMLFDEPTSALDPVLARADNCTSAPDPYGKLSIRVGSRQRLPKTQRPQSAVNLPFAQRSAWHPSRGRLETVSGR
jgi:hypothetical protein